VFQPLAAYKTLAEGAILVLAFQYLPEGLLGRLVMLLGGLRRSAVPDPRLLGGRVP